MMPCVRAQARRFDEQPEGKEEVVVVDEEEEGRGV